ncbi:MAG: hypothetical protein DRN66_03340 [Candidatus Nanohalarchaeota archaeon]|nr:MAG: hypothetical protein DRN66_03340 [Candidatus Nanohaloarchaeota archaeon]
MGNPIENASDVNNVIPSVKQPVKIDEKLSKKNECVLTVGEIPSFAQSEIGIGIGRMDYKYMSVLGIREGDAIELNGRRKCAVFAVRAYPSDLNLDILRIDGITRKNLGITVGDKIIAKPLKEYAEAKYIKLKPMNNKIVLDVSKSGAYNLFFGRIVSKKDWISPIGPKQHELIEAAEEAGSFDIAEALSVGFQNMVFEVDQVKPDAEFLKITKNTLIDINYKGLKKGRLEVCSYEDVGGLKNELKKIREIIDVPLNHPEIFLKLGIESPKGILLYGPPGCGKTLIAKAIANESRANFMAINGSEIMSKWVGDSEKKIRQLFKDAQDKAPCIIFIDEIDAIAPKRDDIYSEVVDRKIVAQILGCMDGLNSRKQVIVIAATNRPDSLDNALRRPGRFDREIEISPPNVKAREEILQIHTRFMPLEKDVNLKKLSQGTHGYAGADLEGLCKEAALVCLRRTLPGLDLKEDELTKDELEKLTISKDDFKRAMQFIEPSAMREVMIDIPKTRWTDIGGLEEIKQKLKEVVEWPIKKPQTFKKMGITPPRGILLYGLPGVGKTLLVKAIANESECNFISIKTSDILSKWLGESEKYIKDIFKKARQVNPCIIFIDEIDAIFKKRGTGMESIDSIITQFLTEIDGLEGLNGVILIAATNRPDLVDTAFIRNGRFDRHIYVPLPDEKSRKKIFELYTKKMPLEKDVDIDQLIGKTKNFVGADIENLCRETSLEVLRSNEKTKTVSQKDFLKTLETFKPSIKEEEIKSFEKTVNKTKNLQVETLTNYG